jgi:hypothetical protein
LLPREKKNKEGSLQEREGIFPNRKYFSAQMPF